MLFFSLSTCSLVSSVEWLNVVTELLGPMESCPMRFPPHSVSTYDFLLPILAEKSIPYARCLHKRLCFADSEQRAYLINIMQKMERFIAIDNVACIHFRPKISSDRYYIKIMDGYGCSSFVSSCRPKMILSSDRIDAWSTFALVVGWSKCAWFIIAHSGIGISALLQRGRRHA